MLQHGRRPSVPELAAALSISVDDLRAKQDEIALSDVTSLNTLVVADDETTVERIDTLAAGDDRLNPEAAATVQRRPRSASARPSRAFPSASARSP